MSTQGNIYEGAKGNKVRWRISLRGGLDFRGHHFIPALCYHGNEYVAKVTGGYIDRL